MNLKVYFTCKHCTLNFWVDSQNLHHNRHIECPNCENPFHYSNKLATLLAEAAELFKEIRDAQEAWSLKLVLEKE